MTATMVPVDGGEVWADDSGGDGPALVMLHPGVGDSRIWDPVLTAFTGKYRVIRYDARGFGQSPAPTVPFSLLPDLVAVLDYFGVGRAAVVGCSQGGASALGLALKQPERVSALVLLCPGVPGFPWQTVEVDAAAERELDAEAGRAVATGDVEALASVAQRVWGAAGATPEAMEPAAAARSRPGDGDHHRHARPGRLVAGRGGEAERAEVARWPRWPVTGGGGRGGAWSPGT